eukprot:c25318_g1_i3 orf=40-252(+)
MDVAELEHMVTLLHDSLHRLNWRLKRSSRDRLALDIAALCMGLRPVVMVDYGGKMPQLQEKLCAVLAFLS